MEARDIIRTPSITEKSNIARTDRNVYVFEVHPTANKIQIKRAIEGIFNVTVVAVNTQNRQGKMKRMGRWAGRRSRWKKAIVRLKAGNSIQIFEGA